MKDIFCIEDKTIEIFLINNICTEHYDKPRLLYLDRKYGD